MNKDEVLRVIKEGYKNNTSQVSIAMELARLSKTDRETYGSHWTGTKVSKVARANGLGFKFPKKETKPVASQIVDFHTSTKAKDSDLVTIIVCSRNNARKTLEALWE